MNFFKLLTALLILAILAPDFSYAQAVKKGGNPIVSDKFSTDPAAMVYKGILNEIAGNSNTHHQSIIQFNETTTLFTGLLFV